jgi:hypothetical protein
MKKDLAVLLLTVSLVCLGAAAWANFSLNNTISNDPLKDIMQRINDVVCLFFTAITYLASSIAALIIIYAGMKYMLSGDGDTASNAKNMIIYAVVGLVLVVLACPIVDYLVIGTKIVPFEKTCDCGLGGFVSSPPGTTTTTVVPSCVDGTPAGQCSATPAYIGYKCVLGTSSYVLVLDSSCGTPSSSSTTIIITSTSTTVSTTSSTTTTTLTDQGVCYNAETGGICPGLNVLSPGYEQDCCNEWGCCCTSATGACTAP